MESELPPTSVVDPDGAALGALDTVGHLDLADVPEQADVRLDVAGSEFPKGKDCSDPSARKAQRSSAVDQLARPTYLDEVRVQHAFHVLAVKARLLAPQRLFECEELLVGHPSDDGTLDWASVPE
jgi:hypothetical protein